MDKTLEGKVQAKNLLNEWIKEEVPKMLEIVKSFQGKTIVNIDGKFSKKFEDVFPKSPCTTTKHFYKVATKYSLYVVFRFCHHPSFNECYDAESSFYLANFNVDGMSIYTFNPEDFPSNYNAKEIENLQKECKEAKNKYENLRNKLIYFGEIY